MVQDGVSLVINGFMKSAWSIWEKFKLAIETSLI